MTAKLQQTVPVVAREKISPDYFELAFAFPELARLAQPGHFVTLTPIQNGPPLLRRPFSIQRVSPDGEVRLLVKIVGAGTRALAELRPGQTVDVLGPLGAGVFQVSPQTTRPIFVAGGVGIAPFLFLADRLRDRPDLRPALIFGGRGAADLVTRERFEALGLDCRYTTEDGSLGRRGLVTDELRARLADSPAEATEVFACGPLPMLRAVALLCREVAVPCQVSLESQMACGLGSCRGCVVPTISDPTGHGIPYQRVCYEGPVFAANQIVWEELT